LKRCGSPAKRRFLAFVAVGCIGFFVDAGLLTWLMDLGLQALPARLLSFAVAVTVTFSLNRRFTFADSAKTVSGPLLTGYWIVQSAGALVNLAVFLGLLYLNPDWKVRPWLPLALASLAALSLTFVLSKRLFASPRKDNRG
jgi:putative flippase GtrA